MSPFNLVCQVCESYKERKDGKTHAKMYVADDAEDFSYDLNEIDISDDDFEDEALDFVEDEDHDDDYDDDEEEEIKVKPKKRGKSSKKKVVEEEEDDEDDEEEFEDEDVALVIGVTKEPKEEEIDYEDEREEGLGKKHRKHPRNEDLEEDEELDEELEELEDEILSMDEDVSDDGDESDSDGGSSVDFEKDVIEKIKIIGSGENKKEICPFCQKSKVSVLRHLPRCKRTPDEIKAAYVVYKKKKK
ncbi:MAG: hypothetical protein ACTSYI_09340 [Promethearchaeota archaeon]